MLWYSKEPSQGDSFFEHPKQIYKLMDKKKNHNFKYTKQLFWLINKMTFGRQ